MKLNQCGKCGKKTKALVWAKGEFRFRLCDECADKMKADG